MPAPARRRLTFYWPVTHNRQTLLPVLCDTIRSFERILFNKKTGMDVKLLFINALRMNTV